MGLENCLEYSRKLEISPKSGQPADVKAPEHTEQAADAGSQGVIDLAQIVHDRPHHAAQKLGLDLFVPEILIEDVKFLLRDLFMAEHLHHLLPGDRLLDIAV